MARRHWLTSVFRHTWGPLLIVLAVLWLGGWGIQEIQPRADSIGDLWRGTPPDGKESGPQ